MLVGEATRRADRGGGRLRGRRRARAEGQGRAGAALAGAAQVTAGRGGALKSVGLEPPFVGRERELRLVKELFHVDRGRAARAARLRHRRRRHRQVAARSGSSRSTSTGWPRRVLAPRPLPRLRRGRRVLGARGDGAHALRASSRRRSPARPPRSSRATLDGEHAGRRRSGRGSSPGSRTCSALEERGGWEREDLFSAWRVFFERLADQAPVRARLRGPPVGRLGPAGLHRVPARLVAQRTRSSSLTLARPELAERRPDWGAGKRNFTSLFLEPLPRGDDGRPPQRPRAGLARRARRAGAATARRASRSTPSRPCACCSTAACSSASRTTSTASTGAVEKLEVPETLHALVAARLDGLSPAERRLLQDAAVLGKTFTARGARARSGPRAEPSSSRCSRRSSARRSSASRQDPRSPERGQYGFLQDDHAARRLRDALARPSARRGTSPSRRTSSAPGRPRRTRSSRCSPRTCSTPTSAQPDADDAPALRERAGRRLVEARRAGRLPGRARGGGAVLRAARSSSPSRTCARARLRERIADVVAASGAPRTRATASFERGASALRGAGEPREAARLSARLGEVLFSVGQAGRGGRAGSSRRTPSSSAARTARSQRSPPRSGRLRLFSGQIDAALRAARAQPRDRRTRPARAPGRTGAQHEVGSCSTPWHRPEEALASDGARRSALALAIDALAARPACVLQRRRTSSTEHGNYEDAARRAEAGARPCAPGEETGAGRRCSCAADRSALHARAVGRGAGAAARRSACGPGERVRVVVMSIVAVEGAITFTAARSDTRRARAGRGAAR